MFFIFDQAPYGFRIALTILGFKCRQIQQRIFFLLLFPDPSQFRSHLLPLPVGNGVEDIALFMHQTPLAGRRCKQRSDSREQSIMSIRDDQIDFSHSTVAQIL